MSKIEFDRRVDDRRKQKTDYKRRKFDRREGLFYYDREVYLTDTNAFGNTYFAQYFDFMGEAREEFLKFLIGDHLDTFMKSGVILLTVDASIKYMKPLFLFDRVRIYVSVKKLTKMKGELEFTFKNPESENIHAVAGMTVATSMGERIIPLPDLIALNAQAFIK